MSSFKSSSSSTLVQFYSEFTPALDKFSFSFSPVSVKRNTYPKGTKKAPLTRGKYKGEMSNRDNFDIKKSTEKKFRHFEKRKLIRLF